jgi:hypothetical protein
VAESAGFGDTLWRRLLAASRGGLGRAGFESARFAGFFVAVAGREASSDSVAVLPVERSRSGRFFLDQER